MIDNILWSSFKDYCTASWEIFFPEYKNEALIDTLKSLLIVGEKEEILLIKDTHGNDINYGAVMDLYPNESPEVIFESLFELSQYKVQSKLFYQDSRGILNHTLVTDTGRLLQELIKEELITQRLVYSQPTLTIRGPQNYEDEITITISLYSDLWMPMIYDFRKILDKDNQFVNNKELYTLNTSRLNNLLFRLNEVVINHGGKMEVDTSMCWKTYESLITSTGILPDFPLWS